MTTVEIVSPGKKYNKQTCITAGELRQIGFSIPDCVPDCGWIYRMSLAFSQHTIKSQWDKETLHLSVEFKAREPFRWERTCLEVDMTPDEIRESIKVAEEDKG